MKIKFIFIVAISVALSSPHYLANGTTMNTNTLRVATFNVSMEATNYVSREKSKTHQYNGNELTKALESDHLQIKNIAEIIQQVNPDIVLLNEFDYLGSNDYSLSTFIERYLSHSQNESSAVTYPYTFQANVNTGVLAKHDLNGDNQITLPEDAYGFGRFPGQYGMAILSKFPIDKEAIRTFQYFKWRDMPNALKPIVPATGKPWYSEQAWNDMRLSSKSHWDVPVIINDKKVHVLASHPTPPVFDGPEDRNGKRNHDEIRFWNDYISQGNADYIYDDQGKFGGISLNSPFIILGDLNASAVEGNAINSGIDSLLSNPIVQDPLPHSIGGELHSKDNDNAKYHTAYWRMRADYVLPSTKGWKIIDSGVFWPQENDNNYRLIESRQASSDHRLVWVDLALIP